MEEEEDFRGPLCARPATFYAQKRLAKGRKEAEERRFVMPGSRGQLIISWFLLRNQSKYSRPGTPTCYVEQTHTHAPTRSCGSELFYRHIWWNTLRPIVFQTTERLNWETTHVAARRPDLSASLVPSNLLLLLRSCPIFIVYHERISLELDGPDLASSFCTQIEFLRQWY